MHRFDSRTRCHSTGRTLLTISRKRVGITALSQVLITRADNFGFRPAERDDAGRFIVDADEMSTAFLELHAAIHRQREVGINIGQSSLTISRKPVGAWAGSQRWIARGE